MLLSPREYTMQYQHPHPTLEKALEAISEPDSLHSRYTHTEEPIDFIVCTVISSKRFLLAPLKEHKECGVNKALLTEYAVNAVLEKYPKVVQSLRIGSIINARLIKSDEKHAFFSHFVKRVEKIWDKPLVPIHSTANLVQILVECDLSVPGRCKRVIMEKGKEFFVLTCKYGIEVCISTARLTSHLENDMTIKGSTLECVSILMEGGPTSFRILDTCKIIKKTVGELDEILGTRRSCNEHNYSMEDEEE